jgi:multiple antibiotic resistance protein
LTQRHRVELERSVHLRSSHHVGDLLRRRSARRRAVVFGDDRWRRRAQEAGHGAQGGTRTTFAVAGNLIFSTFGITLGAFRIAGGVLLFLLALDMMRAQTSSVRQTAEEEQEGAAKDDIAIIPLTIPMLAGPGAIATTMVCVSNAAGRPLFQLVVAVAITLTSLAVWLILRSAILVERRLGTTGLNVLTRVMGLILAALAVQFVVEGIGEVLPTMLSKLKR